MSDGRPSGVRGVVTGVTRPELAVFVSGVASMGLEILAGRMVAPQFGSSIYTWGTIIGVFLAALSYGYHRGGRRAARRASTARLSRVFLLTAVYVVGLVLFGDLLVRSFATFPLPSRFASLPAVVVLFGPPTYLLGYVSPYAAELSTREGVGEASGHVYALGTVGSIVGAFGTTFVLVPTLDVTGIALAFGLLSVGTAAVLTVAREGDDPDGSDGGGGDADGNSGGDADGGRRVTPGGDGGRNRGVDSGDGSDDADGTDDPSRVGGPREVSDPGEVDGPSGPGGRGGIGRPGGRGRTRTVPPRHRGADGLRRGEEDPLGDPGSRRDQLAAAAVVTVLLVAAAATGALGVGVEGRVVYETQTPYQELRVVDSGDVRTLYLDGQRHSAMDLDDPDRHVFEYTRYFHLAVLFADDVDRVLFVGGGGFTGPKRFLDAYGNVTVDVVEIDPEVVRVARRYFRVGDSPRLNVHVAPARQYLRETDRTYDVVVLDAYRKDKVPFQLTTVEFFELVRDRLDDDGVLLANLISAPTGPASTFYRAEYRTASQVFGQVYTFPTAGGRVVQNVELVATKSGERVTERELLARNGRRAAGPNLSDAIRNYRGPPPTGDVPVLRDGRAPVDSLLDPLVGQRYVIQETDPGGTDAGSGEGGGDGTGGGAATAGNRTTADGDGTTDGGTTVGRGKAVGGDGTTDEGTAAAGGTNADGRTTTGNGAAAVGRRTGPDPFVGSVLAPVPGAGAGDGDGARPSSVGAVDDGARGVPTGEGPSSAAAPTRPRLPAVRR